MRYIPILTLLLLSASPALADMTVTDQNGNSRIVTDRELSCIGHIVLDPPAWVQHAADKNMLWAIDKKAAKWCPIMDDAKAELGDAYESRVERDAE
jgi:hypothetical protein